MIIDSVKSAFACLLCLAALAMTMSSASAQHIFNGTLRDSETRVPIPYAHISNGSSGQISDSQGHFSISYEEGDSLYITHVNYAELLFNPKKSNGDLQDIFLIPVDMLLTEITIYHLPDLETFKERIRSTNLEPTDMQVNVLNNMQKIKLAVLSDETPEMTSMDNFNFYMQDPKGVSIFSTDPNKGLIRAIRTIYGKSHRNYQPSVTSMKPISTNQFWKYYKERERSKLED